MGTQKGGGSQLPGVPPTGTQASGGTQPSLEWLPGSSHQVAGSAAVMATLPAAADARRRQIHPRDLLTYPRDQTRAASRADRLHQKRRCC
jgi:hypothetical protein